ncbi:MAG: peptidoglycan DD-metalloendopeptidase family protein [Deltaproteobacteria bacterium]|nr:peptidoglycan DD-metalloendopeptidase family protein [Deltaproteobacteria bacterium]
MRMFFLGAGLIVSVLIAIVSIAGRAPVLKEPETSDARAETKEVNEVKETYREIDGIMRSNETIYEIFKRHGLDIQELLQMREASTDVFRLRHVSAGQSYKLLVDEQKRLRSFVYRINDDSLLKIVREDDGFTAEKIAVEYEKRIAAIEGAIEANLFSSIGGGKDRQRLALNLSDIFAWDIDFTTDMRNGDIFKIIVEELYENGGFKRYGNILAAEFVNNGETYHAYRFEYGDMQGYYDREGKSLRRAFLKAPLNYRRISSGFSRGRFHPILKKYRPHHGVDYATSVGTPVSAVGDGTVLFAGYRGDYGKLIIIRHPNGYETRYGHLSRFARGVKKGGKIKQGDTIGYVGSTGLTTGPHLHYEMRLNNRFINPLKTRIPAGRPLPDAAQKEFIQLANTMTVMLASMNPAVTAVAAKDGVETVDEKM